MYKKKKQQTRLNNINKLGYKNKIIFVEHHQCHAATAYYGRGCQDGPVLIMTNDGSGDELCATVSIGDKGKLKRIAETKKGDSLANIYARVTFMLGMVPLEHEYKLMGMAPYASPKAALPATPAPAPIPSLSDLCPG